MYYLVSLYFSFLASRAIVKLKNKALQCIVFEFLTLIERTFRYLNRCEREKNVCPKLDNYGTEGATSLEMME